MDKKDYIGFVKWMSKERGYGFISPEEGYDLGDVFCHCHDCKNGEVFGEGEKLVFNIVDESKGKRAINVRRFENE